MVFKVVSGVGKSVWDLYNSRFTSAEFVTAALNVTNQHNDHYKNRVMIHWDNFNSAQARVTLYKSGISQKELIFNTVGTSQLNWFTVERLTNSSWTDIETEPRNFFSVQGHCHLHSGKCRSFFINRAYTGCNGDNGWLVAGTLDCPWETTPARINGVLYSSLSTYATWSNDSQVGVADVLAVFLK